MTPVIPWRNADMCGIVGCITKSGGAPGVLIQGLKRLEYRGYDSAGIAVIEGGSIKTVREVGKLTNLEQTLNGIQLNGRTGLGHTRWATHGRPTQINAHPHRDTSGKIVVVHNGIIENFRELRERLQKSGHRFESDTDSEVIAHLVASHMSGNLCEAVRLAVRELDGTYAIGVLHADCPDVLIGARKDSPLIVGIGQGEVFLASDATAIIDHTKQIVFLEDGEIAELSRSPSPGLWRRRNAAAFRTSCSRRSMSSRSSFRMHCWAGWPKARGKYFSRT